MASERAKKMYKNSPRIEKDPETGSAKLTRKSVDDGTEGVAKQGEKPEVTEALKKSMYDRHMTELEDLVKKQKKERGTYESTAEDGAQEINNIENNQGE